MINEIHKTQMQKIKNTVDVNTFPDMINEIQK